MVPGLYEKEIPEMQSNMMARPEFPALHKENFLYILSEQREYHMDLPVQI